MIKLENGRYGHAPIRSDTSIRVYTMADTDTSTPCVMVSQPLISLDQGGRLENATISRNGWHTPSKAKIYRPLATNQLAHSVSFKTG